MISCPKCEITCDETQRHCPSCGEGLNLAGGDRYSQDKNYLSQDSWSFPDKEEQDGESGKVDITSPLDSICSREESSNRFVHPSPTTEQTTTGTTQQMASFPVSAKSQESAPKPSSTIMGVTPLKADETQPPEAVDQPASEPVSTENYQLEELEIIVQPSVEIESIENPERLETELDPIEEKASPIRIGALSRNEDERFRNNKKQQLKMAHPRETKTRFAMEQVPIPTISIFLGISAAILICTWLIPDLLTNPPVFSFNQIGSTHGMDLVVLLIEPACGAILLALLVAPFSFLTQAIGSLAVGIIALSIPLLFGDPPLPINGRIVFATAIIGVAIAFLIFIFLRIPSLGQIAIVLVPGTILATSIIGVIDGKLPSAHLAIVKAPLKLYASMLITGMSAVVIFCLIFRAHQRK
jgi:hypothetical protein